AVEPALLEHGIGEPNPAAHHDDEEKQQERVGDPAIARGLHVFVLLRLFRLDHSSIVAAQGPTRNRRTDFLDRGRTLHLSPRAGRGRRRRRRVRGTLHEPKCPPPPHPLPPSGGGGGTETVAGASPPPVPSPPPRAASALTACPPGVTSSRCAASFCQ